MRLFEAIIAANHRAVAGDTSAGLRPAEFVDQLPIIALTCIDPRLNPVLPEVLGVPEEQFIWLRNAGNIITGPLSSTMRSLALACAVKGGREIAIIGHTDCQVAKCTAFQLLERLRQMGVQRQLLPDNINEYFGMFGSERQNVIKGAEFIRSSPLIGSQVPVHGLVVDTETGKLEWLVNGYETIGQPVGKMGQLMDSAGKVIDAFKEIADFKFSDFKLPDVPIGDVASSFQSWTQPEPGTAGEPPAPPPIQEEPSRRLPLPPRVKPKLSFRKRQ